MADPQTQKQPKPEDAKLMEEESHQIKHLKARRANLLKKIERIDALPGHPDHDHEAALQRAHSGISHIDKELKSTGAK